MQCGGMKKATKMKAGGSTLSGSAIKKAPVQLYGIPQENMGTSGQYGQMKKGGAMKKKMAKGGSTFGMLSVKAGVDNNPNATAADRIAGATKKAKFGATVKVQRSPKAGKVRSAGDQGYAAVGKREPGRIIKKVISKKK